MPNYEALYFQLFACLADAVEQIDRRNYGTARDLLIRAQQDAEHSYISQDDGKPWEDPEPAAE